MMCPRGRRPPPGREAACLQRLIRPVCPPVVTDVYFAWVPLGNRARIWDQLGNNLQTLYFLFTCSAAAGKLSHPKTRDRACKCSLRRATPCILGKKQPTLRGAPRLLSDGLGAWTVSPVPHWKQTRRAAGSAQGPVVAGEEAAPCSACAPYPSCGESAPFFILVDLLCPGPGDHHSIQESGFL